MQLKLLTSPHVRASTAPSVGKLQSGLGIFDEVDGLDMTTVCCGVQKTYSGSVGHQKDRFFKNENLRFGVRFGSKHFLSFKKS